jgi:hypothetical protein
VEYLIISASTEGSRYVECLDRQREIHGDRFAGFVMPDRGSWAENTKLKPDAFRLGFALHQVCLWVDADCAVNPPDDLPPGEWDVAVTQNIHPNHKCRISAGFILIRNSDRSQRFLDLWERENQQHKKDHPALMRVLRRNSTGFKVLDMTKWLKNRHTINAYATERGVVS